MTGILFTLAIIALFSFIFVSVNKAIAKAMAPKDVEIDTPLDAFKESDAISKNVQSTYTHWMKKNVTRLYETMCVLELRKYENDPTLNNVITQYFKIINGDIVDINGINTPSENILGKANPHYALYLRNQINAMNSRGYPTVATFLKKELNRIEKVEESSIVRAQFISHLTSSGIDPIIALKGTTDKKLDQYDKNDWVTYIKRVKSYVSDVDFTTTLSFVTTFDDSSIVLDANAFEKFSVYIKNGMPKLIVEHIITGAVSEDQALRIVNLVQNNSYSWSDAIQKVLEKDLNNMRENTLRKKYGFTK